MLPYRLFCFSVFPGVSANIHPIHSWLLNHQLKEKVFADGL
jgi:hypothetical protein